MFLRLKGIEFLNFIADVYKVSDDDRKKRVSELAGSDILAGVAEV